MRFGLIKCWADVSHLNHRSKFNVERSIKPPERAGITAHRMRDSGKNSSNVMNFRKPISRHWGAEFFLPRKAGEEQIEACKSGHYSERAAWMHTPSPKMLGKLQPLALIVRFQIRAVKMFGPRGHAFI